MGRSEAEPFSSLLGDVAHSQYKNFVIFFCLATYNIKAHRDHSRHLDYSDQSIYNKRKRGNIMESKEGRNMTIAVPRFNIRDTKKRYSELNNMALKGIEVITYNSNNQDEEVSHIKTAYLNKLLDNLSFSPIVEHDEELAVYTVALNEIDLYGEGDTKEKAIEDLITSIIEYLTIYIDKIDMFSRVESETKQVYVLKLLRCNGDREKIRKAIGF